MSEAALPAGAAPRRHGAAAAGWAAAGWGAAALAAGLLAALGVGALVLLALPFLAACALGLLGSPRIYLWILVATSGIGFSWLQGAALRVGGNAINVSGLHWGLIAVVSAAILLREHVWPTTEAVPGDEVPAAAPGARPLRPYAAFVLLASAGILWTPDAFEGIKNAVQFAAPLLVAWVALRTVRRAEHIEALRTAFWVGLAVAALVGLGVSTVGFYRSTGGFTGAMGNRTFAIYLLPLLALALAGWRHRSPVLLAVGFAIVGLAILTLSRMALLAALALFFVAGTGRPLRGRLTAVVLGVLAFALALQYEPFAARFFVDPRVGFTGLTAEVIQTEAGAALSLGGLELTGRGLLWLQTFQHALEAPLLGHGTGAVTHFLESEARVGISHPHNDYLRLFHDLGAVGLAVGVAVVGAAIARLRALYLGAATPLARELALAALLAWVAYAVMALTDNVMVYTVFFTQNVFLLTALALRARALEEAA